MRDSTQLTPRGTEARERWAGWAMGIAAKAPWPSPVEILECGIVLAVEEPGAALEADAEAVGQALDLERRLAAATAERQRLAALGRRLAAGAARLAGELRQLQAKHPRVWATADRD